MRDVIVIGGGAAGLSAALVLARARRSVLVLDAGEPRNAVAAHLHGFLSRDGMPPGELLAAGREEVARYGGVIQQARISGVSRDSAGGFTVTINDGSVECARALLVATGLTDEVVSIPGLWGRWGRTVHHCPYCHGREVTGQRIVVLGGDSREMSLKQAGLLRKYSDHVTFVGNGIVLSTPERKRLEAFGVRVVEAAAFGLVDEGVVLADGVLVEADAVFIAPVMRPNDQLLRSLGCSVTNAGLVAVDAAGQTSVPGVWAAGNVVTPSAQIINAAGAASVSAIAINGWLLQHDMDPAVAASTTNHKEN